MSRAHGPAANYVVAAVGVNDGEQRAKKKEHRNDVSDQVVASAQNHVRRNRDPYPNGPRECDHNLTVNKLKACFALSRRCFKIKLFSLVGD